MCGPKITKDLFANTEAKVLYIWFFSILQSSIEYFKLKDIANLINDLCNSRDREFKIRIFWGGSLFEIKRFLLPFRRNSKKCEYLALLQLE